PACLLIRGTCAGIFGQRFACSRGQACGEANRVIFEPVPMIKWTVIRTGSRSCIAVLFAAVLAVFSDRLRRLLGDALAHAAGLAAPGRKLLFLRELEPVAGTGSLLLVHP